MKTTAIVFFALTLAGCSSFKLGAGCYVPHGVTGQCSITTMEPSLPEPVKTPAGKKA